jgi:glucosylceramidase
MSRSRVLGLCLLVAGCAAPGTSGGGAGGQSTGGSGGSGGAGGLGGDAAGGAGGVSGAGGSATGGTVGTGGSAAGGTGGTTTPGPEPTLITSAQNNYWVTTGTLTQVTGGTIDVTVNDATLLQTFNGFGGTFNEVGWNVLSLLSAADRNRAITLLFDANNGAKFQYGRIPMGANDYSASRYTDDETAGDTMMLQFNINRDKQTLIPYIQAALLVNPNVHLWGSPWTPPTWMKDNKTFDGGNMVENPTNFQALALYEARWVEEYAKVGLNIESIHPQNEPGYSTNYPSCLWTAAGMSTFIGSYLGPTFMNRGITAQIFLGTMSNADTGKDTTIISTVTTDNTAMKFVKGFGLQWNVINSVAGLKSLNDPIFQTEHQCGNYPWNPMGLPMYNPNTAPNDYPYGVESWGLIRNWIKAGVNMYSAWNMVLDTAGKSIAGWPQNALLTVDTTAKTLNVTPAYYVFRHVSQYVDPGGHVVNTSGSADALAFKNLDGTIVVVIYNSGAARNFIAMVAGKRLQFAMPANGFATINWKPQ